MPPQSFNHICQVAQCACLSNTRFHWPTLFIIPNSRSIGSPIFAGLMPHSAYTLHCATPFPPKICPFPWGIWTLNPWSNASFFGPTQSSTPSGSWIISAVFAQYTVITNQRWTWDATHTNRLLMLYLTEWHGLLIVIVVARNLTHCEYLAADLQHCSKSGDVAVRVDVFLGSVAVIGFWNWGLDWG